MKAWYEIETFGSNKPLVILLYNFHYTNLVSIAKYPVLDILNEILYPQNLVAIFKIKYK